METLFAIVVTVCMIAAPTDCVERDAPLPGANELTCLMQGQAEIPKMLTPGWRVARYGCRRAG